ncbi:MAG: hypothetical protein ACYTFY_22915 [Planctomycetota bacterium]|jgi:hypothetical protein
MLKERAGLYTNILEDNFYDNQGLMYAYLDSNTRKPFIESNLKYSADPVKEIAKLSYINSAMTAGQYLSALCYRHKVDKSREAELLIDKVFNSLEFLIRISEGIHTKGWLCKPFGGKATLESTNDQYGTAILGLLDLSQSNHEKAGKAKELAINLAQYWLDNNCTTPNKHFWMGGNQWGLVSMSILRIGYFLSNKQSFKDAAESLCEKYQWQVQVNLNSFIKINLKQVPGCFQLITTWLLST